MRNCGKIFCHKCSSQRIILDHGQQPVRVCDSCARKPKSTDTLKKVDEKSHPTPNHVETEEVESDEVFKPTRDTYETLEQVQDALKDAGLESSNLILGLN